MITTRPHEEQTAAPKQGDRFDGVKRTSRVGAHRAVERPGSPGAWVLVSTLIALILTAVGILLYTLIPSSVSFVEQLGPDAKAPAPVAAEIDPETTVAVLNGTDIADLAFAVDTAIGAEGWGTTTFAGNAEDRNVKISAVFYSDEASEGLAKGLGEKLGGISYYQNASFVTEGSQLTVLLGADYSGPGLEEAKQSAGDAE
ncbi:LytR C-terminal domain-containing protein [Leucobacter sp. UCMA 4100]|uniref:LytR C-terminal domain-containing protein n=1 Tax=Leucobacter sp. UCMA 4100 TaxID=2810534 RepID=UPI0022EA5F78|nr:LytR C-terminal domain-containing protein [Leucobacter sp. UCMA 4100]MDA3147657.1 LytR C-terminal domain-containing protein [Leucobacter sp. UCMA 4100]